MNNETIIFALVLLKLLVILYAISRKKTRQSRLPTLHMQQLRLFISSIDVAHFLLIATCSKKLDRRFPDGKNLGKTIGL